MTSVRFSGLRLSNLSARSHRGRRYRIRFNHCLVFYYDLGQHGRIGNLVSDLAKPVHPDFNFLTSAITAGRMTCKSPMTA